MSGHIRRRGARSWELKFDRGRDPTTGRRQTEFRSIRGTKREAEAELTRLMASALTGDFVDASKITVGEFLDRWLRDWASVGNVGPKTCDGYALIARSYVVPHLGSMQLQKLKPITLTEFYARLLREGGRNGRALSARSVGNVHRLLHAALQHAVRWGLIAANPADKVRAPRVESPEVEILDVTGITALLERLRGKSLYMVAVLGLSTGMRRGEMLALRWQDIDAAGGKITIARALEQSAGGLRFKATKTKSGRRTISIPPSIVAELRRYRLEQQERWLALGLGRISDDALVLATWDGGVRSPNSLSRNWNVKVPEVTLHALRHTPASQLIAAGVDVVTVSRRLGHAKPTVTLSVYAHLFSNSDDRAADVVEATFAHFRD